MVQNVAAETDVVAAAANLPHAPWNKMHVTPDDYKGENARIMAKLFYDARANFVPKTNVTPKSI